MDGKALLVVLSRKRPKPFDIQTLHIPAVHKEETNRLLVEHTPTQA